MKVQWLHLTPTKMGLALHCHGELKLTKWKWKRKRYKEEDGVVPTSPSTPPNSPNRVARAPKCPRCVSPHENRRKRANLPHQRTLAPRGRVSPPGASQQIVGKSSRYCPTVSKCRQAVSSSGTCLALVWRLVLAACSAWCWLCVAWRFLLTFLLFSLLFRVTHLSRLLEQSFQSTKRTQKWGLVVYLDQCNPKCIYLQK